VIIYKFNKEACQRKGLFWSIWKGRKGSKDFLKIFVGVFIEKKIFRSFQPYSKVNDMVEKFLKYGEYD